MSYAVTLNCLSWVVWRSSLGSRPSINRPLLDSSPAQLPTDLSHPNWPGHSSLPNTVCVLPPHATLAFSVECPLPVPSSLHLESLSFRKAFLATFLSLNSFVCLWSLLNDYYVFSQLDFISIYFLIIPMYPRFVYEISNSKWTSFA